jgi:hypothetical protein
MTLAVQERRSAEAQAYRPGLGEVAASAVALVRLRILCASALLRFCAIHG